MKRAVFLDKDRDAVPLLELNALIENGAVSCRKRKTINAGSNKDQDKVEKSRYLYLTYR